MGQTRFFIPIGHYETIGTANVFDSVVESLGPPPKNNQFNYQFYKYGDGYQTELHSLRFNSDWVALEQPNPEKKSQDL